eukprot:5929383-Amphidinium_carterae.1
MIPILSGWLTSARRRRRRRRRRKRRRRRRNKKKTVAQPHQGQPVNYTGERLCTVNGSASLADETRRIAYVQGRYPSGDSRPEQTLPCV